MDFSLQTLPEGLPFLAAALIPWALWSDWRRCDWRALINGPVLNRLLGATVVLMLLWSMSTRLRPGFALHFLGVTASVLIFGRAPALAALAVASIAAWLVRGGEMLAWPFNFALLALMPAWFASRADAWLQRRLPNHFFVFIFLNACFVAAATMLVIGVVSTALLALQGEPLARLFESYLPYFLMLGFGEAWLSGMVITLLVVYKPGWVASFDDRRFLMNK